MTDDHAAQESLPSRELIFNFLVRYKSKHNGNTPTTREIATACCLSVSTVKYHLAQLQIQDRIRVLAERPRQIEIVGSSWSPPGSRSGPSAGQSDQDTSLDREQPAAQTHRRAR
jgi:SOS-response transcriptional repressor LexA